MTPQQKAKEIVETIHLQNYRLRYEDVKSVACYMCDEIIKALDESLIDADIQYYKQVKEEIKKYRFLNYE